METKKVFVLYRDNESIFRGNNYNDCLIWLHQIQGQSWDYALTYGGYKIIAEQEQPVNIE